MSLNCVLKNCCPDHIKVSYFENQLEQMPPSANYDESVEQYKSFISGMSSFRFGTTNWFGIESRFYYRELIQKRVTFLFKSASLHLLLQFVSKVDKVEIEDSEWLIIAGLLKNYECGKLTWSASIYNNYAQILRHQCDSKNSTDLSRNCAFRVLTLLYKAIFDSGFEWIGVDAFDPLTQKALSNLSGDSRSIVLFCSDFIKNYQ